MYMPYKNPDVAKAKRAGYRARRKVLSDKRLCSCGCGTYIDSCDGNGKPVFYVFGHKRPLPPDHVPKRIREAPLIPCGCGCGEFLPDRNEYGNKQRYIYGHVSNKKWPTEEPPPRAFSNNESERSHRLRRLKWSRKMVVLRRYGGEIPSCACCGETNPIFLAIDHTNGGGNKHRRELTESGVSSVARAGYGFYNWLIKQGFPDGYRVLCHNCNMAMAILGYCPHHPLEEIPGSEKSHGGSGWEQIAGFAGEEK